MWICIESEKIMFQIFNFFAPEQRKKEVQKFIEENLLWPSRGALIARGRLEVLVPSRGASMAAIQARLEVLLAAPA